MKLADKRFIQKHIYRLLLLLCLLACSFGCICSRDREQRENARERNLAIARIDQFYYSYVNGDPAKARESLNQAINFIKATTCFSKDGQATFLWLEYARLATLEYKLDNMAMSGADLLESQYWHLVGAEASDTPPESEDHFIKTFDIKKCVALVESMDRHLHDGRLAQYNN